MSIGLGLGIPQVAVRNVGGGGAAPLLSSVATDGWQGVWADGTPPTFDPNGAPVYQTFTRQGFDATATAISFSEQIPMLRRVRQPYPNEALPTASNVALGDYILSTDSASGVTNNSTEISPKPIANWVMRDRQLVGDTIDWEIVAFHYSARDNKQVACVRVRANDGTTQTPWQVVSTTAISSYCEDANPVEVYRGTLDVSTLADGPASAPTLCWLEAEVYPHVGADNATYSLSSVLKSEQNSDARDFSRRYFGRSTARAATPPLAYVISTGNDATGVWSTTAATAEASPFATVAGAMVAMDVGAGNQAATNSIMDGCRIRVLDTVPLGATIATNRALKVASVVVERAPATSRANAIVTWSGGWRPRLSGALYAPLTEGAITFYDVTLNRTAAVLLTGDGLQLQFHNAIFNNNSATGFRGTLCHPYFFGCVMPATAPTMGTSANLEMRMIRGLVVDMNNLAHEFFCDIGCNITRTTGLTYAVANETKSFIGYSNKWLNPSSSGGVVAIQSSTNGTLLGGIAWVQNLIEAIHTTTSTAGFRVSNDSPAYGSITHAVIHHNTDTGWSGLNRSNFAYDESPVAKSPAHKFISYVGNLLSQLNNKGDIFDLDGTKLAAFAFTHGVGCRGTFTQFAVASPATESQTFPGLAAKIGTNNLDRQNPLFTNYQGTGPLTGTGGPIAGAGGGTYTLTGPSPARSMVVKPVLAFDLAGSARPTSNDAAGAYA